METDDGSVGILHIGHRDPERIPLLASWFRVSDKYGDVSLYTFLLRTQEVNWIWVMGSTRACLTCGAPFDTLLTEPPSNLRERSPYQVHIVHTGPYWPLHLLGLAAEWLFNWNCRV